MSDKLNKQGVRDLDAVPKYVASADGQGIKRNPASPPARAEIMEQFQYAHLPAGPMRETSAMFAELAERVHKFPRSEERGVALRKLLEGKDAAVRAARKL